MTAKVERGVGIPWYRGAVCHTTSVRGKPRSGRPLARQAAERLVIQLRVRRLTLAEVSLRADGHIAVCETRLLWSTSTDGQADHFSSALYILERT